MKLTRNFITRIVSGIALIAVVSTSTALTDVIAPGSNVCFAETDYNEMREERKTLPIQSNEITDWPEGPAIGAQSAILMEMNTHTILYAKNIDEKNYPASTTKILTCLLAMQNCSMDEKITFSRESIYDVPTDGSRLGGVDTGDTMLMEQALYCVLVQSANDVASAVGEHVAEKLGKEKSVTAFAQIMNEKAKSLGCKNTHFTNANGLYDDNHYTTVYDLALIGCEFFNNELLCKMSSTPSYHFKLHPNDEEDAWISSKNQLYKGKPYEYKYLLGSKTGFVSQSRQTLVSAAEKNGMKLVCVIFTEETPYQFEDTITLFQYGFENFQRISINEYETKYKIDTMDLFDTDNDIFGDSTSLISMENDSYVILPNTAVFSDTESTLSYHSEADDSDIIATINYTYSDVNVGSCDILFSKSEPSSFGFAVDGATPEMSQHTPQEEPSRSDTKVIFINVKTLILCVLAGAVLLMLVLVLLSFLKDYNFSPRGQSIKNRRTMRHESRIAKRQSRRNIRHQRRQLKKDLRKRKK